MVLTLSHKRYISWEIDRETDSGSCLWCPMSRLSPLLITAALVNNSFVSANWPPGENVPSQLSAAKFLPLTPKTMETHLALHKSECKGNNTSRDKLKKKMGSEVSGKMIHALCQIKNSERHFRYLSGIPLESELTSKCTFKLAFYSLLSHVSSFLIYDSWDDFWNTPAL